MWAELICGSGLLGVMTCAWAYMGTRLNPYWRAHAEKPAQVISFVITALLLIALLAPLNGCSLSF